MAEAESSTGSGEADLVIDEDAGKVNKKKSDESKAVKPKKKDTLRIRKPTMKRVVKRGKPAPPPKIVNQQPNLKPMLKDPNLPSGWKRKVVERKSGASAGKFDVYLFSPDDKKFRSVPELVAHLRQIKSKLTADNFDFTVWGKKNLPPKTKKKSSNTPIRPSTKGSGKKPKEVASKRGRPRSKDSVKDKQKEIGGKKKISATPKKRGRPPLSKAKPAKSLKTAKTSKKIKTKPGRKPITSKKEKSNVSAVKPISRKPIGRVSPKKKRGRPSKVVAPVTNLGPAKVVAAKIEAAKAEAAKAEAAKIINSVEAKINKAKRELLDRANLAKEKEFEIEGGPKLSIAEAIKVGARARRIKNDVLGQSDSETETSGKSLKERRKGRNDAIGRKRRGQEENSVPNKKKGKESSDTDDGLGSEVGETGDSGRKRGRGRPPKGKLTETVE